MAQYQIYNEKTQKKIMRPKITFPANLLEKIQTPHYILNDHRVPTFRIQDNLKAVVVGVNVSGEENGTENWNLNVMDGLAFAKFLREEWGVHEKHPEPYKEPVKDPLVLDEKVKAMVQKDGKPKEKVEKELLEEMLAQEKVHEKEMQVLTGAVKLQEVLDALDKMCSSSTAEENVLFYYSGPSMAVDGNTYLLFADSYLEDVPGNTGEKILKNSLSLVALHRRFLQTNAKVKAAFFDCNYSGQTMPVLPDLVMEPEERLKDVIYYGDDLPDRMTEDMVVPDSGWFTMAACDLDQFAYESDQLGGGVFTYILIKTLKNREARRNDQQMSLEDVKLYVSNELMNSVGSAGFCQVPQFQCDIVGKIRME
ncbi:MAG: caspase family protein [Clostridiales bacterium]|nr:caspase family protein [Candidatus Blautia equi]